MRSILYIIVVIVLISWVMGAFVYDVGGLIHILLVVALIAFILSFIKRPR
ncbi:lmo0937 family membrane protein [Echinicola strongylocentroti]|uniref:Lmo0937 family membrane protein n=1 Tax=Echinicola strongylocentroti TaxID=1795355 RepID=A0A2Z4ILM2_9BACT|nr:lmo0937 family membrane protein [Echinicola strongylocentroti]AWW32021.1 lmo0937 family membrane protein [Echinicola strongylocentroti]